MLNSFLPLITYCHSIARNRLYVAVESRYQLALLCRRDTLFAQVMPAGLGHAVGVIQQFTNCFYKSIISQHQPRVIIVLCYTPTPLRIQIIVIHRRTPKLHCVTSTSTARNRHPIIVQCVCSVQAVLIVNRQQCNHHMSLVVEVVQW